MFPPYTKLLNFGRNFFFKVTQCWSIFELRRCRTSSDDCEGPNYFTFRTAWQVFIFQKKKIIFWLSLEKSKIKTQLRTFKNPSYFLETRFSTESLISFITIPVLFQYLWYFSWGFLTLVGTFLVHKPFLRTPSKNFRILKLSSRKNHESNVWPNPILLKYHFSK